MTEFVLNMLQYLESPLFWTKRSVKHIFLGLLGIYEIFNITNGKNLDCQM